MPTRLTAKVAGAAIFMFASIPFAKADMQTEMNNMFDSMTYVSTPDIIDSQRRGVISGGRLAVRNKVVNENILSFRPPGFRAGCGGIDMWGGSFSYINKEQFTQLMRSVASNAAGYAFKLAISTMCETCDNIMQTLQQTVQKLNEMASNSCKMAQGLVNNTVSAFQDFQGTNEKLIAQTEGFGDTFQSFFPDEGNTPNSIATSVSEERVAKEITGNLTWRMLKKHQVASWFQSGDDEILEVLMTMMGTLIVMPEEDDGSGEAVSEVKTFPGGGVTFRDLLYGTTDTTVTINTCTGGSGEDECLNLGSKEIAIEGFATKLRNRFMGNIATGQVGIISKLAENVQLSNADNQLLAAHPLGGMLHRLAPMGEGFMEILADDFIDRVAYDLTMTLVFDMVKAANTAVLQSDHAQAKRLLDVLSDSAEGFRAEATILATQIPPKSQIVDTYSNIMKVADNYAPGLVRSFK
jgi:conjugative transfer pilus assembly protein TraH